MTFEQLFSQTESDLSNVSKGVKHVGNRPHYPMFLAVNEGFDAEAWKDVRYSLERIWPQTVRYLVSCQYRTDGHTFSFASIDGSGDMDVTTIQRQLDEAKMQSTVFEQMSEWYLYNLIETKKITSLEEFKNQYCAVHTLKEIIVDPVKAVLILLLDDSNAKRALSDEIRQYLSTDSIYDCRIILSTRDMSNVNHRMAELRRVAGDMIVVSNNDAVSQYDDEDYKARRSIFVNGGTYTASYVLKENPNDRIAIQIYETLIGQLVKQTDTPVRADLKYWNDLLGIKNNKCSLCEDFIDGIRLHVPQEAFSGLPVRQTAIDADLDFSSISYSRFANYTFEDVFENFTATYFQSVLSSQLRVDDVIGQFRMLIVQSAPLAAIEQLNGEMIDQIMSQLRPGTVDPNSHLPQYFEAKMKAYMRSNLLYPGMRTVMEELAGEVEKTKVAILQIQQEFIASKPPVSFADLGSVYQETCNAYLASQNGNRDLRMACAAGHERSDIFSGLYQCFKNMLAQNTAFFTMPLVQSWAARLKKAGEAIYKEIGNALVGDQKERLLLHTSGAVNPQMKVYMLHTTDENGNLPTELYLYLKEAFRNDPSVQYLNTGFDDSLEALIFASVEGINLAL